MEEVRGNLWDYHGPRQVVVTTNIGWSPPATWMTGGEERDWNNMGAGSVLEAWKRFPEISSWYAERCKMYGANTPVLKRPDLRLVFLPVKPLLNPPSMSWNQRASYKLIGLGLAQLAAWWDRHHPLLAMTLPGAGNGGLPPGEVRRLVRTMLGHTDIILVDRQL